MTELRVVLPSYPAYAIRLKLTQGALGICDLYLNGEWIHRCMWNALAGFSPDFNEAWGDETGHWPEFEEAMATAFHKLASRRRAYEPTAKARAA